MFKFVAVLNFKFFGEKDILQEAELCVIVMEKVEEWFVLRTKIRKEFLVQENLVQKGFETELPLTTKLISTKNIIRKIKKPLISGYVFVKCTERQTEGLRFLPGSIDFLRINNIPQKISQSEILRLKKLCEFDPEISSVPEAGTKILITSGVLKGITGIVRTKKNKNYFFVESGINGIYVRIEIKNTEFKIIQ